MEVEAEPAFVKTAHEALDETRRALEEIAAKILFVKKEGKPKSELRELSTQMSILFITLRQLNRTILVEEDRIKAETESAKAPVDFTTLQLHNLMYEKNHYLKAINTCRDFRSKYSDIELVPEEEFLKNAPEDIKEKVLASDAAHDLMLKRFNYELFQRKELCKLREKLEQHKKSLVETIASRKKFLSSLPSHLKSLKKATLPVQQQLGILHSKKLKQHCAAELLPPPLYIVYSQLLAQKEAFGEKIEMEITGSVKDAQTFSQRQASRENGTSTNIESIRLDDDAPDEEEDVQRRRKRLKKNLPKENGDQGGIQQTHPLKVFVHIFDDDLQPKSPKLMSLKFEYLIKLNVVCVGVEDPEQASDENILCNLFPNDTGTELPHQTAKLYAGDFVVFGDKSTRPYMWAQHLAGMDFLPEVPPLQQHSENLKTEARSANVSSGLSLYRRENRVQTVLQRIRSRKKALMALVEQLNFLVKLKWPLLDNENVPWAMHTPLCNLQQWLPVRPVVDSSVSAVTAEKLVGSVGHELDRRSVPPSEIESAREDGELPMALPATVFPDDSSTKISNVSSDLESSRSLTLISKNITPPKMVKSSSFGRHEDDLDLILDMESDVEEKVCIESETDIVGATEKPWVDHAAREFHLVLCRKDGNEQMLKLEATVKISIEYPLRAPFFKLRLSPDGSQDSFECFNELRAMESEVNLHILNILSVDSENYVLAHQIRCLAMLFDLHFNTAHEKRKSNSVVDAGLYIPFNDNLLGRVVRGRDRRRMLSWKRVGNRRVLATDEWLRVCGCDGIYAVGDCASISQRKVVEDIAEIFRIADKDNSGTLTVKEIQDVLEDFCMRYPQLELYLKSKRMSSILELLKDSKGDATKEAIEVDIEEFRKALTDVDSQVKTLPATAQVAAQQGSYLARCFNKMKDTEEHPEGPLRFRGSGRHQFRPFRYKHFGQFAPLGGEQAAAQLPGDWISIGHSSQWLWYSVYASKQVSWRTRLLVISDWTKRFIFGRDSSCM